MNQQRVRHPSRSSSDLHISQPDNTSMIADPFALPFQESVDLVRFLRAHVEHAPWSEAQIWDGVWVAGS